MNSAWQSWLVLRNRLRFQLNRLRERLWVKPLQMCLVSVAAVAVSWLADDLPVLHRLAPPISFDALEKLLSIVSASMLVMAVLAVGAMLSAYASASSNGTPRAFNVVVTDDVTQNALSRFIGAFIFSLVALVALLNNLYEQPGRFVLFVFTVIAFVIVILSFVRWVDRIARLGRLGNTIDKVESATASAIRMRAELPTLGAAIAGEPSRGEPLYPRVIGYVQRIDIAGIQQAAEKIDARVVVSAIPGRFASPDQPLVHIEGGEYSEDDPALDQIRGAFRIGGERTFDEDPRFGFIVLSEIASRALSPAVNDPGTAIDIIGTEVRLFALWISECDKYEEVKVKFDRVAVPALSIRDMFDDAFNAICRDAAGTLEVGIRLQKGFQTLANLGHETTTEMAQNHAGYALRHAEKAMVLPEDFQTLRAVAMR